MKKIVCIALVCGACWVGPFRAHAGICSASACGDIDNSGVTTAVDALATLRLAVGLEDPAPVCEFTICRGNKCTTRDLKVSTFPVQEDGETCFQGHD